MKDMHSTQTASEAIICEPESDGMTRSQRTLMKPPSESGTTYGDKSKLMRESGSRMAVRVAVLTAPETTTWEE